MNLSSAIDRIKKAARKHKYSVRTHFAGTGSTYLHCDRDGLTVTVRVADHMECYPPIRGERQICVSRYEATATQAISLLKEGPEAIAPYEPVRDIEQERIDSKAAAEEKARKRTFYANWQTLLPALREDIENWPVGKNGGKISAKQYARELAKKHNVGAGKVYAALTNGKSM